MAQTSWQVTVAAAGTAVIGPSTGAGIFAVSALSANTGSVYIGNDGANDVTTSNGYELRKDGPPVVISTSSMDTWWFDAGTNGDKACIIKLQGQQHGTNPPAS